MTAIKPDEGTAVNTNELDAKKEKEPLKYHLLGLVGQGYYGRVFCALHRQTGQFFALKELDSKRFSSKTFLREFRFLTTLRHPNIVACHSIEYSPTGRYLVMDYCEGGTLRQHLESEQLSLGEGLRLVRDILRGLNYIHQQGLIHCDLKPENILLHLGRNGWIAKISDFGIARAPQEENTGSLGDTGSPAYMAPERFYGETSFSCDLYAIGIILYELAMGKRPFSGLPAELMSAHINQTVEVPKEIPYLVRCIIHRALHKLPAQRYPSAEEMLKAVEVALQVEFMAPKGNAKASSPASNSLVFSEPVISRQEPLPLPLTALAVEGKQLYRGSKFQLICQTYGESVLTGEMVKQWQMKLSQPVKSIKLRPQNCYVMTTDSGLYRFPTKTPLSTWKAADYVLFSFPSSDLMTAIDLQEAWVAIAIGSTGISSGDKAHSTFSRYSSSNFQILQLPTLLSLKPPTSCTFPSHLYALDSRYGLAIFPQNSKEEDYSETALRLFTRRGIFINNLRLPIAFEQVVLSHVPYRLLGIEAGNSQQGFIIDLKPLRLTRFPLEIVPTTVVATQWGYVLANSQGQILLLDLEGHTMGAFNLPQPCEITAISPCHNGLLIATWLEKQGTLYGIDLRSQLGTLAASFKT